MSNDCLLPTANNGAIVAAGRVTNNFIKSRIFTIRGVQVMLDRDLAVLIWPYYMGLKQER